VLREYALLADGERGVVVGPRGDFAWLCFPRWDDDAMLASLLGGGGSYELHPAGRFVWGGSYEPGGLIWRSRWVTDDAIVECREALALPARGDRAVVLRQVIAQRGTAAVEVVLDLRADFGSAPARDLRRDEDGTWRGRAGDAAFAWTGGGEAIVGDDGALSLSLRLEEGACHDLVLVLDAHDAGGPGDPADLWRATEEAWARRVPELHGTSAARDARHAYAVLSGLTSTSGGMVAAATTSLPERARAGRNYDYRYAWIRDQCYAGQAAARSGAPALLDEAVRFVGARLLEHGPQLKPAYTVMGDDLPDERELPLPGYPGGGAKVGNQVNRQFQLDAFGEALLLFAAAGERDRLDADARRAAVVAVEAIEARWHETDAGVWELDDEHWTHSRLMCVAGLRAIADHAPAASSRVDRWRALADRIFADAASRLVHPSGRWQRAAGDRRVDAALLLGGIRGATAPDDPRAVATLEAVARELCVDGYAYRFRPDERPLGDAEGAFLLCGFLMALALDARGDHVGAARWFERNRAACGPPGLLSEEYDVRQRQMRGNLPQAFVHALLLECAVTLEAVAG
jgi:alpha,alpha-trehalase